MQNEYPDLTQVSHPYSAKETPTNPDSENEKPVDLDNEDEEREETHFYVDKSRPKYEDYVLPHPIWTQQELESVVVTHKKPETLPDRLAYLSVSAMRLVWDLSTGYLTGRVLRLHRFSHRQWLLRVVFLETVAGVPGMMFGMVRHLNSLRRLERDRGWIRSLLTEAENERVHLLTAMRLYKPSKLLRYAIVIAQGIMSNALFLAYLVSPRFCHSFVGYLEEQAVHTYGNLLKDIDEGLYPEFQQQASGLATSYWKLPKEATWRDVFANIRADEAHHRDVNHDLANIVNDPSSVNPYRNIYR
eukprot:CAMPEP_0197026146 /NCGR_PEP_ID=MMETSP1384-20130603/6307_1 /TAXON_ID=29189 /ORGANISM="Ammonia sp." /LENGTH=300 /DNA_ID=CAMNT_0042454759 /DNA_START=241 /DNA_END=1143 /DNA_ORIENTATION=-